MTKPALVFALLFFSFTGCRSGVEFTDAQYRDTGRQFAASVASSDLDTMWGLASSRFQTRMGRSGLASELETYFGVVARPAGVRDVVNVVTGEGLDAALAGVDTPVSAENAVARVDVAFEAGANNLFIGLVLVENDGALKVGDFWFYSAEPDEMP